MPTTRTITETTSPDGTVTRVIVERSDTATPTPSEPLKYGRYDNPPAGQRRDCHCGNRFCPICG